MGFVCIFVRRLAVLDDYEKRSAEMKKAFIISMLLTIVLSFTACVGGGSSSDRSWSDLSETEKANARWAYEVQQGLNK